MADVTYIATLIGGDRISVRANRDESEEWLTLTHLNRTTATEQTILLTYEEAHEVSMLLVRAAAELE